MTDRSLRVLLIDGQMDDSHWVQELLAEIEEGRHGAGWLHGLEVFPLDHLSDAAALLSDGEGRAMFDAVLLNPRLPDSVGLHSLLRLQTVAPELPVLVLADEDDQSLAISMTRAGAQDFVAKTQLDLIPLARTLRLAVERSRIVNDLRAQSGRDELTGLENRNGFEQAGERDLAAARHLGFPQVVLMMELGGMEQLAHVYGRDEQQLALIEAAELLGGCAPPPAVIARVAESRFAISLVVADLAEAAALQSLIARRMHLYLRAANRNAIRVRYGLACQHPASREAGDIRTLLDAATESLCENKWDLGTAVRGIACRPAECAASSGRNV